MSSQPTPIQDPGVTVATGEPGHISAAGDWHHRLATTLESHSSLIKSTASVLLTGWNGDASKQYQTLSTVMSGHYEATAEEARAVGSALKRFSAELGNAQGEGRVALKNAIHWMNEVNEWQDKLAAAEAAKAAAQTRVKTAMSAVVAANHAASAPGAAPAAAGAAQRANSNLQAARNALAKAETDESTATKNLKNAANHFTMWQKKGGHALQEAEKAAGVAGLALGAVAISVSADGWGHQRVRERDVRVRQRLDLRRVFRGGRRGSGTRQLAGPVPGRRGRVSDGQRQRQHHRGPGRCVGPGLCRGAGEHDGQRRLEPARGDGHRR